MPNDEVSIADGATFAVSDRLGDIVSDRGHGFFRSDTRFLSRFVLTLDGLAPRALTAGTTAHHTAKFYATNPELPSVEPATLSVVRERRVTHQLSESISITSHARRDVEFEVGIAFDADFADIFEVHGHATQSLPACMRA